MTVIRLDPYQNITNVHWRTGEPPAYAGPWYRIARKLVDRSGEDFVGQADYPESTDPLKSITKASAEWLNSTVWDEAHKADALSAFAIYGTFPEDFAVYLMVWDAPPFTDPLPTEPPDDLNDTNWVQYSDPDIFAAGYHDGDITYTVQLGENGSGFPENACPPTAYGPSSGRWFTTEEHANNQVDYLVSTGGLTTIFGTSSASVRNGHSITDTASGTALSCTLG